MKLSPKKRVLTALLGGQTDRIPVTSVTGCCGSVNVDMQTATDIFWPDAHKDPEQMAKLAIAGYEIGGKEEPMVPFLAECGFDGISVAETVNIAKIKPLVGEVKLLGNVSSKKTLTQGTPEDVKAEVKEAIAGGADLIEPSCGIPPETPTVNIKAMVAAVKTYGG